MPCHDFSCVILFLLVALSANMSQGNVNGADPPAIPPVGQPPPGFYEALINRLNEPRPQTIKSIPCSTFRSTDDFDLWVVTFEDNVRAAHNMTAGDPRLPPLFLNWVSTKLEVGPTRSVYDNLPDTSKADWQTLKQALSKSYKDDAEEIRFLNNDDAWVRTDGMTLIDYKNGLMHKLNKYLPALRTVQGEWDRVAVRRFRAGLKNPILEAHILMSCRTPDTQTLDHAYLIAANYENTLSTITQKGNLAPNMAAMLNIPTLAPLSEPPQFSALTPLQEKTQERLSALETAAKKHELDVSELKAGLTEVKDGLKTLKDEITQSRVSQPPQRPMYQRMVKPLYPVSRMPMNPFVRPYYQGSSATRPKVVSGLTGGPGYVTHQPATPQMNQTQGTVPQTQSQSTQMANSRPSPLAFPQRPPGTTLGALSDPPVSSGDSAQFANPNLQYGSHDLGHGWTNMDVADAQAYGYDPSPDGFFVYTDAPF